MRESLDFHPTERMSSEQISSGPTTAILENSSAVFETLQHGAFEKTSETAKERIRAAINTVREKCTVHNISLSVMENADADSIASMLTLSKTVGNVLESAQSLTPYTPIAVGLACIALVAKQLSGISLTA